MFVTAVFFFFHSSYYSYSDSFNSMHYLFLCFVWTTLFLCQLLLLLLMMRMTMRMRMRLTICVCMCVCVCDWIFGRCYVSSSSSSSSSCVPSLFPLFLLHNAWIAIAIVPWAWYPQSSLWISQWLFLGHD